MVKTIVIIVLVVALVAALVNAWCQRITNMIILYYIGNKGYEMPSEKELEECGRAVKEHIIADMTGKH